MKTIYLNANYECSVTNKEDTVQTVETAVFDGKCKTYIEGMRFVPEGQSWTRPDGVAFAGPMLSPAVDSVVLTAAQGAYEDALSELRPVVDDILVAMVEV